MNLNISPSPFDVEQINEDYQDHNPRFSCQVFFDSTDRDPTSFYNQHQLYQHHHHPEDDCCSHHGGSPYDDDNNDKAHSDLNLTLCSSPVKWKPSRVEPIRQTKMNVEEDRVAVKIINTSGRNKVREDDQKVWPSSSLETRGLSSNSSCNIVVNTIRVCSDCNTTKTPLWRSGPKGPKSLCNACGIRQRKSRRAIAAAAAAAATVMDATADHRPPPVLKIKMQPQNKQKVNRIEHGQDSKFKKRSKITASADGSSSSSNVPNKLNLEDLLIKLRKNLSLQGVFPQDEKDAAILLMALSSGGVHG